MAIGSKPEASQQGRAIIFINQDSLLIQVAAFKQGKQLSNTRTFKLFPHKALNSKVTLVNEPAPKYRSMGGQSLVDGVKGTKSYSAGHWVGFEGKNPEVLIEMEKPTTIETVDLRFLESNHSWIFLPKEVKIFTSADGVQFVEFATVKNPLQTTDSNRGIVKFHVKKKCKQLRFIKIVTNCFTECPPWHPGNGKPAWAFMDEIIVK
jgi:hexosaminidase